jgi:hypothetical protein
LNFAQLMGWMQLAQVALPLGIMTEQSIAAAIRASHGSQMSEADINKAIGIVLDDATRRKALAIADALGTPAPAAP